MQLLSSVTALVYNSITDTEYQDFYFVIVKKNVFNINYKSTND